MGVTLNFFRYLRRQRRLQRAVEEEVFYLRRAHGQEAYAMAVAKLKREDLTEWGRQIVKGAAHKLKRTAPTTS